MNDVPSRGELMLYLTEDGRDTIRLRAVDGTAWLPLMQRPFRQEAVVKESLTTAFARLDEGATCKDFLQLRPKGPATLRAHP
ncbi:hypothetical protein ACVIIV_001838 [Bradyrhizobium sp. USDA 4354]